MDGVLADWHASCAALLGMEFPDGLNGGDYRIQQTFGISVERLREICHEEGLPFWTEIPWTPFGRQLKRLMEALKMRGHIVGICTDASWTPYAPQGKHLWLHRHGFKDIGPRVLTREKWLLACKDALLIDDSESQVEQFREYGGNAVLVPRRWNYGGELPAEVVAEHITTKCYEHLHGHFYSR